MLQNDKSTDWDRGTGTERVFAERFLWEKNEKYKTSLKRAKSSQ